jgi:uncharacterized protein (TIGR00269 family)
MSSPCDRCSQPSVIFLRYSGQHLCGRHFLDLIRRRIRREVRQQGVLKGKNSIGVAVSGGKDSIVLLSLLDEIIDPVKGGDLVAVTIDEGIEGYRSSALVIAREVTKDLGIEWKVFSFRDLFNMDLDTMVKKSDKGPCTICGILRRKALNLACIEMGCQNLATGHNLDDMAQTVLMNVMSADLQRIARLGPHLEPIPGFIPRVFPLRSTPETETHLAAYLLGLPIHDLECPYAVTAKRGSFRDLLMKAEGETPGTRHSLLKFQNRISNLIPRGELEMVVCNRCGDPVYGNNEDGICRSCALLLELGAEI